MDWIAAWEAASERERTSQWTRDEKLRQPVFLGLREDKRPAEVKREAAPERFVLRDLGVEVIDNCSHLAEMVTPRLV